MKFTVRFFALVVVAAGFTAANSTPSHLSSTRQAVPNHAVAAGIPLPTCFPGLEECPNYR